MTLEEDILTVLNSLYEESVLHWTGFSVDREFFVAHAQRCIAGSADPLEAVRRLRAAELYLACACAEGESVAIRQLVDSIINNVNLARVSSSQSFSAEVRQRVAEKLLVASPNKGPCILKYVGRGSLASWVQVTAIRTAIELRRQHHRERQLTTADVAQLGATDQVEIEYLKGQHQKEFRRALEDAFATLSDRQRSLLRMNVVDQLNIAEIGKLYQVHRATVARWLATARESLFTETRKHLEIHLGKTLSPAEFESFLDLVLSRIDVSIRRLLDEPAV
ncbi:MAG: sigma-70 family RNA polymerase sigma factor [Myxococcales bacterium]|nr:sigma-70 family RNA polymerase sigma factor [Myxococcales bacterium]